jgi:hypothetical protein
MADHFHASSARIQTDSPEETVAGSSCICCTAATQRAEPGLIGAHSEERNLDEAARRLRWNDMFDSARLSRLGDRPRGSTRPRSSWTPRGA